MADHWVIVTHTAAAITAADSTTNWGVNRNRSRRSSRVNEASGSNSARRRYSGLPADGQVATKPRGRRHHGAARRLELRKKPTEAYLAGPPGPQRGSPGARYRSPGDHFGRHHQEPVPPEPEPEDPDFLLFELL